jgi:hypothetical protein
MTHAGRAATRHHHGRVGFRRGGRGIRAFAGFIDRHKVHPADRAIAGFVRLDRWMHRAGVMEDFLAGRRCFRRHHVMRCQPHRARTENCNQRDHQDIFRFHNFIYLFQLPPFVRDGKKTIHGHKNSVE